MTGTSIRFPSLVCAAWLSVVPGASAEATHPPLTDQAGDPDRGREILRDTSRASCLICHSISALPDRDQGELGPPLDGVGSVYTAGELRLRIMDARRILPDTIMPPYYATNDLYRVGARWVGQTIYSAQDVEDVVAFVMTLVD